jgi:alcohol dehydrogenase class IV
METRQTEYQGLPPVIYIPTTSGTGSEANPAAMLTDKKRNAKVVIMNR